MLDREELVLMALQGLIMRGWAGSDRAMARRAFQIAEAFMTEEELLDDRDDPMEGTDEFGIDRG